MQESKPSIMQGVWNAPYGSITFRRASHVHPGVGILCWGTRAPKRSAKHVIITTLMILIVEIPQKISALQQAHPAAHSLQFIHNLWSVLGSKHPPFRTANPHCQARPTRFLSNDEYEERREESIHAMVNLFCPVPQGDEMCDCHKTQ